VIFILHFNKITQSAKVISEVQITGWPDSTYNCIHKKEEIPVLTIMAARSAKLKIKSIETGEAGLAMFKLHLYFIP
jgi:hypothetical protein